MRLIGSLTLIGGLLSVPLSRVTFGSCWVGIGNMTPTSKLTPMLRRNS